MDSQADQTFCNYTEILMILPNRISLQVHLSFKNRLIIVLGSTKKLWSDWPGLFFSCTISIPVFSGCSAQDRSLAS